MPIRTSALPLRILAASLTLSAIAVITMIACGGPDIPNESADKAATGQAASPAGIAPNRDNFGAVDRPCRIRRPSRPGNGQRQLHHDRHDRRHHRAPSTRRRRPRRRSVPDQHPNHRPGMSQYLSHFR